MASPEYNRTWAAANPDYRRGYRSRNREKLNHQSRRWRAANRERVLMQGRARWQRNLIENRRKARVHYHTNRETLTARAREWRKTHPARVREIGRWNNLKHKYGVTRGSYEGMFTRQKGRCACCLQPNKNPLTVDHCHRTGAVRGLLCGNCNAGLGQFKDSVTRLQGAIKYLRKFL